MRIDFEKLIRYKLNRHDDIHLLVGKKLGNDIGYAPETFRSIFLETMRSIDSPRLIDVCRSLPFGSVLNDKIYCLEMDAEIQCSIINCALLPLDEYIINAPAYFTYNEIIRILNGHGVTFTGNIIFDGHIEDTADATDMFAFEKGYFGATVGEIRFLREMAANGGNEQSDDEKFFYNVGASIIAPVYVLYAEWILRFCEKHSVKLLLPMMREATVLIKCITNLGNIECKPLYCSRRFLFNASINEDNFYNKISQILIKSKATPTLLCEDIGLDGAEFLKFSTMADLKAAGLLENFSEHLYSHKGDIISYSKQQRQFFCKELYSTVASRKAATVDIGFSGTSESLIKDILQMQGCEIDLSHLILMGADGAQIKNIRNGLKIYSWLGMAGENTDLTKQLMYQIQVIEPLLNDICGTTLAYNNEGPIIDSVIPIGLEKNYPRALACQRGIDAFINLWKQYREKYNVDELLCNKVGFINIWRRLIETPDVEEAERIGGLLLYDNYTTKKTVYKVGDDTDGEISNCDRYLENISRLKSDFPQARVVIQNPNYFKEKLLEKTLLIPGSKKMMEIIEKLDNRKTAIFAAGQRGRDFLRVAKLFGADIVCFIDSDQNLQGKKIDGIPVISIDAAEEIDVFINASYNYPDEITQSILENWGFKKPIIFTFD